MNSREQFILKREQAALDRLGFSVMLLERTMSLAMAFAFDVGMLGAEAASNAYSTAMLNAALERP